MNARILAATITLAIALVANSVTAGTTSGQVEIYKKALSSVPKLEMPAKAALVVKNAKTNKKQVALDVLQAAISIAPASAPSVVRAISRIVPEFGSELAVAASGMQPQQSLAIHSAIVPMSGSAGASQIVPAGAGFTSPKEKLSGYHTVVIVNPANGQNYSR